MRKLIVQQWVTVDNVAAEEDGGLGFVSPEPFDDGSTDDPFQNDMMAFIGSVDTMILGARTYDMSKGYWPYAEDQGVWGQKLNALTKFVASSTLREAPWGDFPAATVTPDAVATVRELKARDGGDLWLWGSLTLMRSLLEAGVVDGVRLLVCPTSRGAGTRVFSDRQDLALVGAVPSRGGVVLLTYDVRH